MIMAAFSQVRPDQVEQLRAFGDELDQRRGEMEQALATAGTRQERAFLLRSVEPPIVVFIYDFDDPARATQAFRESNRPVDRRYKQVMDTVLADPVEVELLYDVTVPAT